MIGNIRRRMKLVIVRAVTLGLILICVYAFLGQTPSKNPNGVNEFDNYNERDGDRPIVVLSWNENFGYGWLTGCQADRNTTDLDEGLLFTNDRNQYSVANVVFFSWLFADLNDLPNLTSRPKGQIWVLYSGESPAYTQVTVLETMKNLINFTSSYRLDDDFSAPFGTFRELRPNTSESANLTTSNHYDRTIKNGRIVWLVSHCNTDSKRERYVRKLNESIAVDEYGQCSKVWPPHCEKPYNNVFRCYEALRNYTFYLAFENSICKDYATEKVFFAYEVGMIPIVLGGYDYDKHFPADSYINAMNYPDPNDLANYLLRLLETDTNLEVFYRWKLTYRLSISYNPGMEAVRQVFHYVKRNRGLKSCPRSDRNLMWWWYYESECRKWDNKSRTYRASVVGKYERTPFDDVAGFMPGGLLDRLDEL